MNLLVSIFISSLFSSSVELNLCDSDMVYIFPELICLFEALNIIQPWRVTPAAALSGDSSHEEDTSHYYIKCLRVGQHY